MTLKDLFLNATVTFVTLGIVAELTTAVAGSEERQPPADMLPAEQQGGNPHQEREPVQESRLISDGINATNTTGRLVWYSARQGERRGS